MRVGQSRARSAWKSTALGVVAAGALIIGASRTLRINFTSSLPRGIYRTVAGPPTRGSTVITCLPIAVGRFAMARGYVWRGGCAGGAAPVGKVVSSVAGDTVVVAAGGLIVNGHHLHNTEALAHDSRGRPLTGVPYGVYVVPTGKLWLTSTYNPASFDSRYFGPVSVATVVSRIEPVWTLGSSRE
jgi:conjugative transfer signal peptidase TraF